MNVLVWFKNIGEIFVRLIASIYRTVARTYNLMYDLSMNPFMGDDLKDKIFEITDTLYTLIAIFMLFRITVSLIEYLVDPDKVADKGAGAGKLISRIVISLFLVVLFPTIVDQTFKLQEAIWSSNLFNNLFPTSAVITNKPYIYNDKLLINTNFFTLNSQYNTLELLKDDDYEIILLVREESDVLKELVENIDCNDTYESNNTYSKPFKDYKNAKSYSDEDLNDICETQVDEDIVESSREEFKANYEKIYRNIDDPVFIDSETRPEESYKSNDKKLKLNLVYIKPIPEISMFFGNKCKYTYTMMSVDITMTTNKDGDITYKYTCKNNVTGTYTKKSDGTSNTTTEDVNATGEGIKTSTDKNENGDITNETQEEISGSHNNTYDIDEDGLNFARDILDSFSEPDISATSDHFLESTEADDIIVKSVEEGDTDLDIFLSIICGIVIIVVILILCIEVIVRTFKLIVLEILAPIAFMSYMNPNDKILSTWFKKFMGTFLELFIKIFAIKIGIFFMTLTDIVPSNNFLATLLLYLATFLFMKTAPNFISDIFGIKDMGGTFKEAAGALKNAAMVGGGAAIGGVIGAASGFGKGGSVGTVLGGALGGFGRGALGGAKGNITSGATSAWKKNSAVKASNAAGGNFLQRALSKAGLDSASLTDKKIAQQEVNKKDYENLSGYKKKAEDIADSSDYMKDYVSAKDQYGNNLHNSAEVKATRDSWSENQLAAKRSMEANDGNGDGKYRINNSTGLLEQRLGTTTSKDGTTTPVYKSLGYKYEAGKAAGLDATIKEAEIVRSGNALFTSDDEKRFDQQINSIKSLDDADKAAKSSTTKIGLEIAEAKNTKSYRAGEASRSSDKKS